MYPGYTYSYSVLVLIMMPLGSGAVRCPCISSHGQCSSLSGEGVAAGRCRLALAAGVAVMTAESGRVDQKLFLQKGQAGPCPVLAVTAVSGAGQLHLIAQTLKSVL